MDSIIHVHNLRFHNPYFIFAQPIQLIHETINPPIRRKLDLIILGAFPRARAHCDPEDEQFAVGGAPIPYFDPVYMTQRVSLPSVPVGYASGRRLALVRVSTSSILKSVDPDKAEKGIRDLLKRFNKK
jgi:hypothetical protein